MDAACTLLPHRWKRNTSLEKLPCKRQTPGMFQRTKTAALQPTPSHAIHLPVLSLQSLSNQALLLLFCVCACVCVCVCGKGNETCTIHPNSSANSCTIHPNSSANSFNMQVICLSGVSCSLINVPSWSISFWRSCFIFSSHNSVVRVTLRSFLSGAFTCQGERGLSALWSEDVTTVVLALAAEDILRVTCLVPVKDVSWKDR